MKFKKGDMVKVYGTVTDSHWNNNFEAVCWFLSQGLKAKVLYSLNSTELVVKFIDHESIPSRSLNNRVLNVHPKQCRKIKLLK